MRLLSSDRVRSSGGALCAVALLAIACATRDRTSQCFIGGDIATWRVSMRDSSANYEIRGEIDLSQSGGSTRLAGISSDGMTEPINYPVRDVRVTGDSLFFAFAPIDVQVSVQCSNSVSASGTFARPNPPFDSLRGAVEMTRERKAP